MRPNSFILGAFLCLCLAFSGTLAAENKSHTDEGDESRMSRFFPVFQIVNFPNDVCASSTGGRNGTCYTSDECSSLGGANAGSCANGFGVCCVFSLACGGSSSQNNTFLVQRSITSVTNGRCDYTICPCSTDICRIKFDFTTFDIASPYVGTSSANAVATSGGAFGDCLVDRFSITAPGQVGSPTICGYNTGQHMIMDASNACHTVSFDIGGGDSSTRTWDIRVVQYKCGDTNAGPDGCLQYFTGTGGTVSSFNFPTAASAVGDTATHLSDQHYNICFRRESGFCALCFIEALSPAAPAANDQISFGLSGANLAGLAGAGTFCSTDFVTIPLGQRVTTAIALVIGTVTSATATDLSERFCGRHLSTENTDAYANAELLSVCTQVSPFTIGVDFDSLEVATEEQDITTAGGIVGFSLTYRQVSC